MALFITFEGGEGSGKSTQANILYERLRKQKKFGVSYIEEPGTTVIGKKVREWLRPSQLNFFDDENNNSVPGIHLHTDSPRAELLAFTIARSQLVEECILPKLDTKNVIVCNRYADSTTAYQGYGRKLDLKLVELANNIATQGIKPVLTILLDIIPERGLVRKFGITRQNFEKEELDFHQRVRQGYLTLSKQEPERWLVIDADKEKGDIADIIWRRVSPMLPR
jgi:dTMP kinase